jgi:hypothetical protein
VVDEPTRQVDAPAGAAPQRRAPAEFDREEPTRAADVDPRLLAASPTRTPPGWPTSIRAR